MAKQRTLMQRAVDCVTFPLRAVTLFHNDRWNLTSLASERFDYVAREVRGYCLDVGCGYHNRFVTQWLAGDGKGVDVFPYAGLIKEQILADMTTFPFADGTFETVTFIANLNHVPRSMRDRELAEAFRCLKPNGNIIITMGNPLAEILVHKLVAGYDQAFGTKLDMDNERGMGDEEQYYLLDSEIVERLRAVGFNKLVKKYFWTQWCLNHLWVGQKLRGSVGDYSPM